MKKTLVLLFALSITSLAIAQIPVGFNYQAIAGDANGNPIRNSDLQVKFTIQSDTVNPVIIWEELHSSVKTNGSGMFSLAIGTGSMQPSSVVTSFSEINWSSIKAFLKTQLYYQGVWKTMGTTKLWSVPYAMAANSLSGNISKLSIAGETTDDEEALFEVKNKDGQTVFAVYNEGVRIYVDNGDKGKKGGFSIGGFANSKSPSQNLFVVDNDSIRAYIDPSPAKGKKGGFSIGGFADSKGIPEEYLLVNPDSTMVFVRKDSSEYSSTFNIVAISQDLERKTLMTANPDTVNIAGVLNLQNDLVVGGDIAVEGTINLVSDIEGNSYKTVKIGTQIWMAENLKTTKYNDGTSIPVVTDIAAWVALNTPAYCWYNNDEAANKNIYGALYNWYAVDVVTNGGKNICPTGWHLSSDEEWQTLISFNGGMSTAGGKLKEAGLVHWVSPNLGATNESGFNALPGGMRIDFTGIFSYLGENSMWWSSTVATPGNPFIWGLFYERTDIGFNGSVVGKETQGRSVRCLKD